MGGTGNAGTSDVVDRRNRGALQLLSAKLMQYVECHYSVEKRCALVVKNNESRQTQTEHDVK